MDEQTRQRLLRLDYEIAESVTRIINLESVDRVAYTPTLVELVTERQNLRKALYDGADYLWAA